MYIFVTPLSGAVLLLMLAIREWVLAGFMAVFLLIGLESGVRTSGTRANRIATRLWRRDGW
jgi:hypothetical protein